MSINPCTPTAQAQLVPLPKHPDPIHQHRDSPSSYNSASTAASAPAPFLVTPFCQSLKLGQTKGSPLPGQQFQMGCSSTPNFKAERVKELKKMEHDHGLRMSNYQNNRNSKIIVAPQPLPVRPSDPKPVIMVIFGITVIC